VVAASRRDAYGQIGFVMREICLLPQFRGQRLGPAVLQHLIDELPDRPGDALWGTIDAENQASLRNANAAGRVVVGGYVWVTPLGLPGMPS
jgi:L-amino acid N-acyltransferase YncA